MDDLISREFMKSLGATCIAARREGDGELIALGGIDMLPSAQPEIVRCEDCKYYEADITANPWGVCCHKSWIVNDVGQDVDENGWCYRAERRPQ